MKSEVWCFFEERYNDCEKKVGLSLSWTSKRVTAHLIAPFQLFSYLHPEKFCWNTPLLFLCWIFAGSLILKKGGGKGNVSEIVIRKCCGTFFANNVLYNHKIDILQFFSHISFVPFEKFFYFYFQEMHNKSSFYTSWLILLQERALSSLLRWSSPPRLEDWCSMLPRTVDHCLK